LTFYWRTARYIEFTVAVMGALLDGHQINNVPLQQNWWTFSRLVRSSRVHNMGTEIDCGALSGGSKGSGESGKGAETLRERSLKDGASRTLFDPGHTA
jgi:hypothetical protein